MGNIDGSVIGQFLLFMVALIFSLSVHESAHAWMSNRFGDDLARLQGRISLNLAAHVDPIGTLLFPAIAYFTGAPLIGWAKPTPVNPLRWRNKDLANVMVSIAGILANMRIAIIAFTIFKIWLLMRADQRLAVSTQEPIELFLTYLLIMNVSLAVFNLLPFPPLDGSRILDTILPASMRPFLEFLEQYGFLILIVLMSVGFFRAIISPVIQFVFELLLLGVR